MQALSESTMVSCLVAKTLCEEALWLFANHSWLVWGVWAV